MKDNYTVGVYSVGIPDELDKIYKDAIEYKYPCFYGSEFMSTDFLKKFRLAFVKLIDEWKHDEFSKEDVFNIFDRAIINVILDD